MTLEILICNIGNIKYVIVPLTTSPWGFDLKTNFFIFFPIWGGEEIHPTKLCHILMSSTDFQRGRYSFAQGLSTDMNLETPPVGQKQRSLPMHQRGLRVNFISISFSTIFPQMLPSPPPFSNTHLSSFLHRHSSPVFFALRNLSSPLPSRILFALDLACVPKWNYGMGAECPHDSNNITVMDVS